MASHFNVSVSDQLARRVRAAGLPISAICQRALQAELIRRDSSLAEAGVNHLMAAVEISMGTVEGPDRERLRSALDEAMADIRASIRAEIREER